MPTKESRRATKINNIADNETKLKTVVVADVHDAPNPVLSTPPPIGGACAFPDIKTTPTSMHPLETNMGELTSSNQMGNELFYKNENIDSSQTKVKMKLKGKVTPISASASTRLARQVAKAKKIIEKKKSK